MRARPTVSVVMPAYQTEAFIEAAVASVRAQTWPAIELIVVDDGSTDATPAILKRAGEEWGGEGRRMVVLSQPNAGAAAACSRALAAASGEHIAFCDADDIWRPRLLERLMARLTAEPDLDIVFPRYVYIDETGAPLGVESRAPASRYSADRFLIDNPIESATGALVRGAAARGAGAFDDALRGCVHLDWFLRIVMARPRNAGGVAELLVEYRRRSGQITSDWRRMRASWERVMAKRREMTPPLDPAVERKARAGQAVFWSTMAYQAGDYAAARRLIYEAWRAAPGRCLRDGHAAIRLAACLATHLPAPVHGALGRGFNRLRGARAGRPS